MPRPIRIQHLKRMTEQKLPRDSLLQILIRRLADRMTRSGGR